VLVIHVQALLASTFQRSQANGTLAVLVIHQGSELLGQKAVGELAAMPGESLAEVSIPPEPFSKER